MQAVTQAVLGNGLTVLVEADASAATAGVGFFVRAGTRDEAGEVMGVSHFLEHMCFKGTATRSAEQVNAGFDDLGLSNNAYTSHEQTVYYASGLPEALSGATELLADMMRPALRGEDFETEKKVILEEIAMYDDRPYWRANDRLGEAYFAGHALGYRVLGTAATVGALSAEAMRGYFDERYAADRIVVAAAGQVDADAFVKQVEALTKDWTASGVTRDGAAPVPSAANERVVDEKLSRSYLALAWPAPSAQDDAALRHAASVYADVLGDSDGSRLYWALVDPGHAEEASVSYQAMDGVGQFVAFASCDPARADAVEATLRETVAGMAEGGGVTEDELARATRKLATVQGLQGERPSGRMHRLGDHWLSRGEVVPLAEETAALLAVTRADVARVAGRWGAGPVGCVRLGP